MGQGLQDEVHTVLSELTPRQRGVLILVGHGLTNAEIAAKMYISAATVAVDVRAIYELLGLDRRVRVAVWAYRAGLIAL